MEEFLTEAHQRKDLHYHLIVGDGEWMPYDPGHPDALDVNIVYDNHLDAHRAFIRTIQGFGGAVKDEDVKKSFSMWEEVYEQVKMQHVLEVITFQGVAYRDLGIPMELVACNSCVPYGMN